MKRWSPTDGRLRGRAGMAQRRRRLEREPWCRDCKGRGVLTPSVVPDHIVPLAKGGKDTDDNVRCLCDQCHKIRTAEQFGHKPKVRWSVDGWPE